MTPGLVTVFGGSGFLGRYFVMRLAARGRLVRVAVREPEAGRFLRPMGSVGQISLVQANVRDDAGVAAAVHGAEAVVNFVGIAVERGKQRFQALHVEGAARIARASQEAGAARLVHLSALGADSGAQSRYARSKAEGERRVRQVCPDAVVLRPGAVFGPEDQFFNRFGGLARSLPVLPLFGRPDGPRFQPVYVGDVADAALAAVVRPDAGGQTFELGGPEVLTMREILGAVLQETGRRRWIVGLPMWLWRPLALASVLPLPAALRVTFDQLRQLRQDSVVAPNAKGLADLGVAPTPMTAELPEILERFARP